jgi:micrococcal nuclease
MLIAMLLIGALAAGTPAPASAQRAADLPDGIPSGATEATVAGHVDGNTILVLLDDEEEEVDLIGVDAPQRGRGSRLGECYGQEAFDRLRELMPVNSTVYLERGDRDRHSDGTLLRFVWVPPTEDTKATLVNTKVIREGYAGYISGGDNDKHDDRMEEQERKAKGAGRGLWAACGDIHVEVVPTPTPTPTVDEIKAQYAPLADVRELAIRPGGMLGQKISFYGTVQVIEVALPGQVAILGDNDPQPYTAALQVDVVAPDGTTQYVFVGYNGDTTGIFEGSYVLVYGTVVGTQSGTNAFGGTVVQPMVSAQFVELQ